MHQLFAVVNTDTVNKYGHRFTPGALLSGLDSSWQYGVPLLKGHDYLKAIGWNSPIAVHFESGLTRFYAVADVPQTGEEANQLTRNLNAYIAWTGKKYQPEFDRLRVLLSRHLTGTARQVCAECVSIVAPDLAKRMFPNIFAGQDEDELVDLNELDHIGPGVYRRGDLALFAHPSFRRSSNRLNKLNRHFLEHFQSLDKRRVCARIALDPDMVGLASTYVDYFEYEYWWGPRFDNNLTSIPPGIVYHKASEQDRIFHGISATEFWWQSRDGLHIFEVEELADDPVPVDDPVSTESPAWHVCRYAHSIVEEDSKKIVHFDGATRAYSEVQMLERVDTSIAGAGRRALYSKLWRLDGEIGVAEWKTTLSEYFRDNRQVGEYLGAQPAETEAGREPAPSNGAPDMDYYASGWTPKGTGVRVAVSFHPIPLENTAERQVIALDSIIAGDESFSVVEWRVIEIRKILGRLGATLSIDTEYRLVSYGDRYVNLPLIVHRGNRAHRDMVRTLEAIRMLAAAWTDKGLDLAVSYSVGFLVEDREVWISAMGHVDDLSDWLSRPLSVPPASLGELHEWANRVADYLRLYCAEASDVPKLQDTLMPTGVLRFQRDFVDSGRMKAEFALEEHGLKFRMTIPEDETQLWAAIGKRLISPALAYIVEDARCFNCDAAYQTCNCSSALDDAMRVEITRATPLSLIWTDRPLTPTTG